MSDTVLAAIIGGAVGSFVTAIFSVIGVHLQRRSDERRQIRELAVKAAIENWTRDYQMATIQGGITRPLDIYLVHAMHLVSALDGSMKTPESIRAHLRQALTMTDIALNEIQEYNKTKRAA